MGGAEKRRKNTRGNAHRREGPVLEGLKRKEDAKYEKKTQEVFEKEKLNEGGLRGTARHTFFPVAAGESKRFHKGFPLSFSLKKKKRQRNQRKKNSLDSASSNRHPPRQRFVKEKKKKQPVPSRQKKKKGGGTPLKRGGGARTRLEFPQKLSPPAKPVVQNYKELYM